jgi:hypothetical protein
VFPLMAGARAVAGGLTVVDDVDWIINCTPLRLHNANKSPMIAIDTPRR